MVKFQKEIDIRISPKGPSPNAIQFSLIVPPGYGNFAAETFGGRIFCLLFGIIGIPLMLTVLVDVSGLMAGGLEMAWSCHKDKIIRIAEKLRIVKKR